jgi:hypothetical protein
MKQFFALALIAGALMVTSPGQARMVASTSQCLASCGSAISTSCGWIIKPGRFNRCRTRLIKQCRKFGTDVMCPTAPPPAPPVTAPTTTTTVPVAPPTTTTTTTLPPNPADAYTGTWLMYGDLVVATGCPASMTTYDTFVVADSAASPGAAAGYFASVPQIVYAGGVTSQGLALGATTVDLTNGCTLIETVLISPFAPGAADSRTLCPGLPDCDVSYSVTWVHVGP